MNPESKLLNFPDIDVVIPTFNSREKLSVCLESLIKQEYPGFINIYVVDGGSTDGTVELARGYTNTVIVAQGIYMFGKNGARNLGERLGRSKYVLSLDSDNYLVGSMTLQNLVLPFLEHPMLNISIPIPIVKYSGSLLNNWLSAMETINLLRFFNTGKINSRAYSVITDLSYGLPNASLVRREDLLLAAGTDTDVRLLCRLRSLGRSHAAIVANAHFYHDQTEGIRDYVNKWVKRITRYSEMEKGDLDRYFINIESTKLDGMKFHKNTIMERTEIMKTSLRMIMKTRRKLWFAVIIYALCWTAIVLYHPIKFLRMQRRYFSIGG